MDKIGKLSTSVYCLHKTRKLNLVLQIVELVLTCYCILRNLLDNTVFIISTTAIGQRNPQNSLLY